MRKKIYHSILAVSITVLLACLVIMTTFLYGYFNRLQVTQLKAELSLVADTLNRVGVEHIKNFDSNVFRFTVVDRDGTVLYDTKADAARMENHKDREEIQEAFDTGKGSSVRNSPTLTEKTYYESVLLENGDVLRVSVSQLTVGALILGVFPAICAVMVVTVLASLLISGSMSKRITEPLYNLDLEHPADNNTYEELTPILSKLNKQRKQIKSQMETLRRKSSEFEQIISSMNEGLVLLDEHGVILSMNPAARKVFSVKDAVIGQSFLTVDRTVEVSTAVDKALAGKHTEFRLQRNGNEYQLNISPIESSSQRLGAVILIFDITDKAFAERNRQEFTANVTHELKTPLQSIIGSAELLETGLAKPEDADKFVGNIKREATRLVNLINDIIRLSQLDENTEAATESVNILEVAKEVVDALSVPAAEKRVTLEIVGEPLCMQGVRRYLYEILYNLCDNAIRYNMDGGKVTVRIAAENGHTTIVVSDTGIGIAPEHHSRIFERFYRVDKSHSRETGGTGLGLSIVKHAVLFHGGKLEVESEVGKGTTIKVIF